MWIEIGLQISILGLIFIPKAITRANVTQTYREPKNMGIILFDSRLDFTDFTVAKSHF